MKIDVLVADESHIRYTDEICEEILISARERGTGIARRTPEYLTEKILAGKAVIAVSEDGRFAGVSYIETWGHKLRSDCSPCIQRHWAGHEDKKAHLPAFTRTVS